MTETPEYKALRELQRELDGVTQMLGAVLLAVDAPVVVTKESINADLSKDFRINIEDEGEAFVFTMEEINE